MAYTSDFRLKNLIKEILSVVGMSKQLLIALEYKLQLNRQIREKLNNGQKCQELIESIGQ